MNPDDPRLTAYALGELDAAESAEIEQLLREEPVLAVEIDTTRLFAETLRVRLKSERAGSLHAGQRAEVLACAAQEMPRRAPVFPRPIVGWQALAAGVVLGIGVALLFPALNSLKVQPMAAGGRTTEVRDGSDVRVSLVAEPAREAEDFVVLDEWPSEGVKPLPPRLHVSMWPSELMAFAGGDSILHFDTRLPVIEFPLPAAAQDAPRVSTANRRNISRQTPGAKALREARYATAPFRSATVEWDTRAVDGENQEKAMELPASSKNSR